MNNSIKKGVVVAVVLLFVSVSVIPSVPSEQTITGDVITVDDEGDGDYTSIKEALNNSNPGDVIEVYSGTFYEKHIDITKQEITIKGIPHELGNGNDTGKPLINSSPYYNIFNITGDSVTITNLRIEKNVERYIPAIKVQGNNCQISYTNITSIPGWGLAVYSINANNIDIIGNEFRKFKVAIYIEKGDNINISYNILGDCAYDIIRLWDVSSSSHSIVSYNILDKCIEKGITDSQSDITISHNRISNCTTGIVSDGILMNDKNHRIMFNEIRDCGEGISLALMFDPIFRNQISVEYNNFIDNGKHIEFYQFLPIRVHRFKNPVFYKNFYDDWDGVGQYKIKGTALIFAIPIFIPFIPIFDIFTFEVPWAYSDWQPAQEPYDIGV